MLLIYKDRIKPERNFIYYSVFVCFFPLLVAGPIERATHLLPQILKKREFNYYKAVDGLRQILWGLFKKVVIADNCAEFADLIFNNSELYPGSTLVLGAIFFTFQIYGDFSGYSDIAIGVARLFGFDLIQNFHFPYFSRDIAEFWRRWHISLSTWFRDYVYIPLGGSRGSLWIKIRNIFVIFLLSGFWHGANWTFVVWGGLNALYFLPLLLLNKNRNNISEVALNRKLPSFKEFISIMFTFSLTVIAWIFFRAENLTHALNYISSIISYSLFTFPYIIEESTGLIILPKTIFLIIFFFIIIEWKGRNQQFAIQKMGHSWKPIYRYLFYYVIILALYWFEAKEQQFIYFQF
jgi:alginate O-acetyltransferase complex protein AlgI